MESPGSDVPPTAEKVKLMAIGHSFWIQKRHCTLYLSHYHGQIPDMR